MAMTVSGAGALGGSIRSFTLALWRRRWLAVAVSCGVAVACAALLPLVPQRYEARALVYIDTKSALGPLMEGMAHRADLDQQLQILARTMISRPQMESLVDRPGIGLPVSTPAEREAALSRLMSRIRLTTGEAGLYTISYRDTSAPRAQRVVDGLLHLFADSFVERQAGASVASRFISDRLLTYEAKLTAAENLVKEFKLLHFGNVGQPSQDHFGRMSAQADVVAQLSAELVAAEETRNAYVQQLARERPGMPGDTQFDAAGLPSPIVNLLNTKRTQLAELSSRYTERHPEMVSLRQHLEELERQHVREAAARAATDASRLPAATNPVFQRMQMAVTESEAKLASIRSRLHAEQQRLDAARLRSGRSPQVEAELARLTREHDVVRTTYQELITRREAASLGEKVDESARSEAFRVVEPPRAQATPVFPSQVALTLMAVVVSIGAGLLAPYAAEHLQPTFTDAKSLLAFTQRPVLGVLTLSPQATIGHGRIAERIVGAAALLAVVVAEIAWLTWVWAGQTSFNGG